MSLSLLLSVVLAAWLKAAGADRLIGRAVGRAPLAAIILGFAFGHDLQDVALLEDLAGTAASLQASLIASAGPAFFSVTRAITAMSCRGSNGFAK